MLADLGVGYAQVFALIDCQHHRLPWVGALQPGDNLLVCSCQTRLPVNDQQQAVRLCDASCRLPLDCLRIEQYWFGTLKLPPANGNPGGLA